MLGSDADQGYHHYYRYTPEHAEILLTSYGSDGDVQVDDQYQLVDGDPFHAMQRFKYNYAWEDVEELQQHGYRSVPEPEFDPSLNQSLGGTLRLDEYVVPFRADFGSAAEILKAQTSEDGGLFVDYRPDFIELAPSDGLEKYQLGSTLRGSNEITGTRIIDEVLVLDRGSQEVYDRFDVDELASQFFVERLAEVDGIDPGLAGLLVEECGNLRTVSWAMTSDVTFWENTYDLDCHELFKALGDSGVYRNENSPDAGVLRFPERRADELSESRQERYFGEVLEPQEGEGVEDDSVQAGFDDF